MPDVIPEFPEYGESDLTETNNIETPSATSGDINDCKYKRMHRKNHHRVGRLL